MSDPEKAKYHEDLDIQTMEDLTTWCRLNGETDPQEIQIEQDTMSVLLKPIPINYIVTPMNPTPKEIHLNNENGELVFEETRKLASCPGGYTATGRLIEVSRGYNCGLFNEPIVSRECEQSSWPSQSSSSTLLSCCMGNTDTTVCSPDDCYGSTSCISSLTTYCNNPSNVYSTYCQSKVCNSILDCSDAMKQYCATGDNIISDTCSSLRSTRPDLTDSAMTAYCLRNPDAAICGCLTITDDVKAVIAKATAQGINFVVQCNLASCIPDSSYKPASMRSICPNQLLCLPSIILDGVSTSSFGNINQTCNQSSSGGTTDTPTTGTTTGTTLSLFGYSVTITQQQIYILLGLLLTLLVAVILLFFGDESKAGPIISKKAGSTVFPPILDKLVT